MVLNRQRRVRVSINDLEQFLARARRALRLRSDSLTVSLVTNAKIARWNRAYRGKPNPTDVLSFPAEKENASREKPRTRATRGRAPSARYLGDIAIAPAVARRNARRLGRTFDNEMRILILHGILHLMGYDHETDTGQMDRREQRLRRALGIA
ncbi:MAG TPA: rRNA maturation RNase YbeY [Candidatus Baltobacteraceae bacterium]|nr:rRNA maturation RNase YbeY [Candidatus Baltobacteraceae bacterium]